MNICQAPACDDNTENGDETDEDCGGLVCPGCGTGEFCLVDEDCASLNCSAQNACIAATCMDNIENGAETDVDCGGGTCPDCGDNLGCLVGTDCTSGVCTNEVCQPPACNDLAFNGDETDVDCGGPDCPGCDTGENCNANGDCLSGFCMGGICEPKGCNNDSPDCDVFDAPPCQQGVCNQNNFQCQSMAVNEGSMCNDGLLCTDGEFCNNGTCTGGVPEDCSALSGPCTTGFCNPVNGNCAQEFINQGQACDPGNDTCNAHVCDLAVCEPTGGGSSAIFFEDFADNVAGWVLGSEWAIGPALGSNCNSCTGSDPAMDHTPTVDNGIAGVLIGGCTNQTLHDYYCITSPVINTAQLAGQAHLTYWRHLHSDYTPFMHNRVDVWDGMAWQMIWQSGPSPCINDPAWTRMTHNVTAYKNASFQARWCFNVASAGAFSAGSWSIDDVTVAPIGCTGP
jgi:hypothetical protein